jgi:CheY-like chemotaxis protein
MCFTQKTCATSAEATSWRNPRVCISRCAVMSGNECIETVQECLQRGAAHYILKPITKKEVQNIWQHAFQNRPPVNTLCANCAQTEPHSDSPTPLATAHFSGDTLWPSHSAQHAAVNLGSLREAVPGSGGDMPLHEVLQSGRLPWRERLAIFCHLLGSTIRAFLPAAAHEPRPQPFVSPDGIYVTDDGAVSQRCDHEHPLPHPCTPFYRPPSPTGVHHALQPLSSVYALGILLFELALSPAPQAARVARLEALPSLPVDLLTARPEIALLLLRMTTANADDRPTLAEVAHDAAVEPLFEELWATVDAEAMSSMAMDSTVQFSFLCLVEGMVGMRVHSITQALSQLDSDMCAVRSPLMPSDPAQCKLSPGTTRGDVCSRRSDKKMMPHPHCMLHYRCCHRRHNQTVFACRPEFPNSAGVQG